MKRIISFIVVLVLSLGLVNFSSYAEEPTVTVYHTTLHTELETKRQAIKTYYAEGFIAVPPAFHGANISIHYTYDNVNWQDINASYIKTLSDGNQVYTFRTPTKTNSSEYFFRAFCKYAIRYEKNGQIYWNNNNGKDFIVMNDYSYYKNNHPYYLGKSALLTTQVQLEYAWNDKSYFRGKVVLKDFSPYKKVFIRYTTDGWQTYKDLPAKFESNYFGGSEPWHNGPYPNVTGDTEVWTFDEGFYGKKTIEFAVCYETNGITYWDNNFERNYIVTAE